MRQLLQHGAKLHCKIMTATHSQSDWTHFQTRLQHSTGLEVDTGGLHLLSHEQLQRDLLTTVYETDVQPDISKSHQDTRVDAAEAFKY